MLNLKIRKCLLLWFLIQPLAWAKGEEAIGYVKTVTPTATLIFNQQSAPAVVGNPVYVNTLLKTDKKGSIGITLKDNTVLSFGPDTEFEITQYVYHPETEQLKLDMSLIKGTLQYISGVIAKLKPNAVKLNTPAGIIGARGTRFVVKVEE